MLLETIVFLPFERAISSDRRQIAMDVNISFHPDILQHSSIPMGFSEQKGSLKIHWFIKTLGVAGLVSAPPTLGWASVAETGETEFLNGSSMMYT